MVGSTLAVCLILLSAPSISARPNVILILADDFGYEILGANGGTSYRTPILDGLARSGVRFEQCYAQPLCTPTRVQLLTGASNIRNYTKFGHLDRSVRTMSQLFQGAGYRTAAVGKWQLGREVDSPKHFGFEESCLWQHTRRPARYANPGLEYNGVEKDFTSGEYGPDLVEAYAEDFILRHSKESFFLFYPMMLTHAPYQPTPESLDWDPRAKGEKVLASVSHFGDMVAYMDKTVGRLLKTLDEAHVRENTLVVFLGDNGTGRGVRSAMGQEVVDGGKGTTTKSGMHVPLIVDWPARVRSGSVCADLIDTTDILPTVCEAAGVELPREMLIDGESFLSRLWGESGKPRRWIYSWYSPHGEPAVEFAFDKRYKLYKDGRFFDMQKDVLEKNPLSMGSLDVEAAEAARMLRLAIDRYRDVRVNRVAPAE